MQAEMNIEGLRDLEVVCHDYDDKPSPSGIYPLYVLLIVACGIAREVIPSSEVHRGASKDFLEFWLLM